MANDYGRGSVASSSMAQKGGGGSAYDFTSRGAEAYLTGAEQDAYRSAMETLGAAPQLTKKGQLLHRFSVIPAHEQALAKLNKLRKLAATRAFGDFQASGTQLSKPWLQKASGGLISEENIPNTLAGLTEFGGGTTALAKGDVTARTQELAGTANLGNVGVPNAASKLQKRSKYGWSPFANAPGSSSYTGVGDLWR